MTIEEKAKAYDEALERAKEYNFNGAKQVVKDLVTYIFPELAESEDERIRKELISKINGLWENDAVMWPSTLEEKNKYITWLEKQGQKSTSEIIKEYFANTPKEQLDKDWEEFKHLNNIGPIIETGNEPKFKVGDWIINRTNAIIMQIVNNIDFYESVEIDGQRRTDTYNYVEWDFRLWTIQDAKDGDVLVYVTDEEDLWIMIYQSLYEPYEGHVHYHALLVNDDFSDKGTCCICIDDLKPATKEQSDFLFLKMKETGYKWDKEKKRIE